MHFKRTTQAVQRCKNEQQRCSCGRETGRRRRYGTLGDAQKAALDHLDDVIDAYRNLFDKLMFKFADGWVNVPTLGEGVGYPRPSGDRARWF